MTAVRALRRLALLLLPLLIAACTSADGGGEAEPGKVEDLGVPVKELRLQPGPLSPDPTGTGFVQLFYSFTGETRVNPDRPFEVVAVDLQTKAVKKVPVSTATQGVGFEVWGSQDPVWSRGPEPKLFFRPNGDEARLMSWDPKTQTVWDSGTLFSEWPKAKIVFSLASGTDNWIIGGGGNDSPIVRYNPDTGEIRESPPASPPADPRPAFAQEVAGDGDATYVLTGRRPYRVVARPHAGGADTVLLQFDDSALFDSGGTTNARLHQTAGDVSLYLALKGGAEYSILENGQMVTRTVPGQAGSRADLYWGLAGGARISPLAAVPDLTPPPVPLPPDPPEIIVDEVSAAARDQVRLWFRFPRDARPQPDPLPAEARPEDYGWQMIDVRVNSVPLKTSQAVADPAGGLFGSTYHRGDLYRFDPDGKRFDVLGPAVIAEVYSMVNLKGKVYIGGYSNARVFEYDPARPWSAKRIHPFQPPGSPAGTDPEANPREIANFRDDIGANSSNYMVSDSAGRLYVGTNSARNRVGGGLGVLTPLPGGGWRQSSISGPLESYPTTGLAVSTDGRYVTLSSEVEGEAQGGEPSSPANEAKVFVLDTSGDVSTFSSEWVPVPGAATLGQVTGVGPTQVVGVAPVGEGAAKIYLLDVVSGQVLRTIDYPGEITGTASLITGPDGAAYTTVKVPTGRRIVRITPDLSGPEPVKQIGEVTGDYERLAVVGRDLYLTGTGYDTNGVASLKRLDDFMAVR